MGVAGGQVVVATSTDRGYVELTGVLLRSVTERSGLNARLVVFGDRLRAGDRRAIGEAANAPVEFVDMAAHQPAVAACRTTIYWPRATYFRLLAPQLLAGDRLLHFDPDIIVQSDISQLATIPLRQPVAAVPERAAKSHLCNMRLRRGDQPYFNAGVLLIDLHQWRSRELTARTLRWLADHPDAWAQDQDALNAVLDKDWQPLEQTYNSHCSGEHRSAHIVHFTGERKPHEAACDHPAKGEYLAFRRVTPWGRLPLMSERRRRARRLWLKSKRAVNTIHQNAAERISALTGGGARQMAQWLKRFA